MNLEQLIEKEIFDRALLRGSKRVVMAVSGGLDSMVLLRVLSALAPKYDWKLVVAHYNHRLREGACDLDQTFVQTEARRLGLEFVTGSGDVRAWAAESGKSLEMAARDLRHRFLVEAARETGADRIALAHHASDQAELFLLRLLRGTQGEGLGGMKWENQSPADSAMWLVRPLLGSSRGEIEAYAISEKVEYRQDASNSDTRIPRNRVRHELLPLLRSIEPEIEERLVRSAEALAAQSDAMKVCARAWLASHKEDFDSLPAALQRTILHDQLIAANVEPTYQLIENLRRHDQQKFPVTPGRTVIRERTGRLRLSEVASHVYSRDEVAVSLRDPGSVRFSDIICSWSLVRRPAIDRLQNVEMFDAGRVGESAILRHWRPGDRFQPIGFRSSAKLQDLFTSAKVNATAKRARTLAATGDGTIFWVEGLRMSELFKVTPATEVGLRWSWQS
jgi:tRNA(Ile)-lysidine synthase